ncbi:MAG TPA: hypothetical protein VF030_09880 [Solirubrobacterales bacterium]
MEFLPAPPDPSPPRGEVHLWRLAPSPDALRRVLAIYLGQGPSQIRLTEGEHGKPRLADPEATLRFNLSHSGEIALVAVSGEVEVGVDVERIRPKRDEDYYWRWASHEAEVKCLGVGLLRARQAPSAPVAVASLLVEPGYAAAVAAAAPEMPPLRGWTFGPTAT